MDTSPSTLAIQQQQCKSTSHNHTQTSRAGLKYADRQSKGQRFLDVLAAIDVDSLTNTQLMQLFKLLVKYLQARMLHEGM
jgi:hypothetical protein